MTRLVAYKRELAAAYSARCITFTNTMRIHCCARMKTAATQTMMYAATKRALVLPSSAQAVMYAQKMQTI
jgi:hypothetical protein